MTHGDKNVEKKTYRYIYEKLVISFFVIFIGFLSLYLIYSLFNMFSGEEQKAVDNLDLNTRCSTFYVQRPKDKDSITINRDTEIVIKFNRKGTGSCDVIINNNKD